MKDVFGRLGYMERQGSGLNKIREAYENTANYEEGMEPEFYSDRVLFMVTLKNLNYKNKALKEKALNENEKRVLSLISDPQKITKNEIKRTTTTCP